MRTVIWVVTLAALAGLLWLYLSGGDRVVLAWAIEGQRTAQTAMAGAIRSLRAGDPAALFSLMAVCFGYGFFHAVGPGHGKLLIGGYGMATQISALRLSIVALISSLAQAATAIALVGAGLLIWNWGRAQMTDLAEDVFAPLSFGAIALVGLWLVWRGVQGWRAARVVDHAHTGHDHTCSTSGHAHGPDPAEVAQARSLRDLAAVIAAVAIRPCTGALFVLILTAQMGVFWAGVAATLAMAFGTAAVTVATALAATTARHGLLADMQARPGFAQAQSALQIAVGLGITVIAGQFTLATL